MEVRSTKVAGTVHNSWVSNITQLSPDPGSQFRQMQALGCTSCPGMQEVSPQIAMPSYVLGFQSQPSSAWS